MVGASLPGSRSCLRCSRRPSVALAVRSTGKRRMAPRPATAIANPRPNRRPGIRRLSPVCRARLSVRARRFVPISLRHRARLPMRCAIVACLSRILVEEGGCSCRIRPRGTPGAGTGRRQVRHARRGRELPTLRPCLQSSEAILPHSPRRPTRNLLLPWLVPGISIKIFAC